MKTFGQIVLHQVSVWMICVGILLTTFGFVTLVARHETNVGVTMISSGVSLLVLGAVIACDYRYKLNRQRQAIALLV